MHRFAVTIAAVSALAVLSACSDRDDSSATPQSDKGTSAARSTESTEPPAPTTDSPTTTEPTDQPTTHGHQDSASSRARKAQISAAALPGFNRKWTWTKQGSGPGPAPEVPSRCMQSSLTAIGAVNEYRTDYGSPLSHNATAVQMTAVFPDPQTAVTASDVLESWHDSCRTHARQDLGLRHVDVSQVSPVSTVVGDGLQWMTTYGPVAGDPDAVWFHAQGFVRDGDTLTYLILTSAGQDYNYEAGDQPIDLALDVAGRYLARTR